MGESEARPQTAERLRWLLEGDPLGLRRAVALRLRCRALLMDGDLLYLRTLARAALEPLHPSEKGAEACVDLAMGEILREMSDSLTAASFAGGVVRELAQPLGLDPGRMLEVCSHFNALPLERREQFFGIVIDGVQPSGSSAKGEIDGARETMEMLVARAFGEACGAARNGA